MPGGLGAKGNCIVYLTHVLYSLQPTAFRTRCLLTGPLVAVLQAHTRPGTPPVTRPGLPAQGLWRAENMGSTQNWPYSFSFTGFGMSKLEGPWEFGQLSPWCTDRKQAHKGFHLFQA